MPKVLNPNLYKKARAKYANMKHSAYKSNLVVKEYKKLGGKYGGTKPTNTGLVAWNAQRWRNQRGGVGYKKKGDVYRPTRRIKKNQPKTFKELGKKRITKAMKEKKKTGRVKKF